MTTPLPLRKKRDIRFCRLHPDRHQARSAAPLVGGMPGVHESSALTDHQLQVGYDLLHISLQQIESSLQDQGYHLDNSLLCKLKRALYYYTEENERTNLGLHNPEANTQVYVSRYQRLPHGCRDERPEHWRNYL
ncbi:MAG: hypothetical protein AB7U81_06130 [Thiohalomonadaceae bacterium]